MNAAQIDRSARLQRLLGILGDGAERSTLELIQQSGLCAINSAIAELRQNGFAIDCRRIGGKWLYKLGANHLKHLTEKAP